MYYFFPVNHHRTREPCRLMSSLVSEVVELAGVLVDAARLSLCYSTHPPLFLPSSNWYAPRRKITKNEGKKIHLFPGIRFKFTLFFCQKLFLIRDMRNFVAHHGEPQKMKNAPGRRNRVFGTRTCISNGNSIHILLMINYNSQTRVHPMIYCQKRWCRKC